MTPLPSAPLRDRVRPGIRALFVGINPGMRSAAIGHHFAGFSNRFWKLLFESGLVAERLAAEEDDRLTEFGYGMTNLVPRATPGIGDLAASEYAAGRRRLVAKVRRYHPQVVVLVGVTLYRALFPSATGGDPLGLRRELLGGVPVFVLPNPSGRNANYSYAEMLQAFKALAMFIGPARRCAAP